MEKIKWLILCVLVSVLTVGFAVAGGGKEESATYDADGMVSFKFHIMKQSGISQETVGVFLEELEKSGKLKIEAYLGGELYGNDEDQLSALQTGAIQGVLTGDMCLSWAAPEWISYTSVPFAFSNNEQFFKFFLGEKGKEINNTMAEKYNMRFLDSAIGARGGRMLTANKPILSPDGMQGIKFRVPNVIGTVTSWEAMGANVIGVPWSELFTSLQSGLVDAQENPYAELLSGGFYQVQSHIMETSHQIGPQLLVVNADFWDSLSPELKEIFNNASKVAFDHYNAGTKADSERIKQIIIENGNTIIPASQIDIDAFKKVIEEKVLTNKELTKNWAPGGWEYIQSLN